MPHQSTNGQPAEPKPWLLTAPEAAGLLNISVRHVTNLVADGTLPAVRLGRVLRFEEADLRAVIQARKTRGSAATRQEVQEEQ